MERGWEERGGGGGGGGGGGRRRESFSLHKDPVGCISSLVLGCVWIPACWVCVWMAIGISDCRYYIILLYPICMSTGKLGPSPPQTMPTITTTPIPLNQWLQILCSLTTRNPKLIVPICVSIVTLSLYHPVCHTTTTLPPLPATHTHNTCLIGCLKGDGILLAKVECTKRAVLGVTFGTLQCQSPCAASQLFSLLVTQPQLYHRCLRHDRNRHSSCEKNRTIGCCCFFVCVNNFHESKTLPHCWTYFTQFDELYFIS